MKYYLEITLIDGGDEPLYFIWSKLYAQLHLALVKVKNHNDKSNIGVSFPEYRFNEEKGIGFLGTKLRMFANSKEELHNLNINSWLARFSDYLHITSIREVPEHKVTGYAIFRRKQVKTNIERLARRYIKRHDNGDFAKVLSFYPNHITLNHLPYVEMKSLTNTQPYKIFIEKNISENSNEFEFNTYGLSLKSSVPEF